MPEVSDSRMNLQCPVRAHLQEECTATRELDVPNVILIRLQHPFDLEMEIDESMRSVMINSEYEVIQIFDLLTR